MCGQVNEEDFYVLHHEMGHLYYYLAYNHQPHLFQVWFNYDPVNQLINNKRIHLLKQSGANSAFHEAVGDTIVYAAMATQHRKRLGFPPPAGGGGIPSEIVHLLRQALVKVRFALN